MTGKLIIKRNKQQVNEIIFDTKERIYYEFARALKEVLTKKDYPNIIRASYKRKPYTNNDYIIQVKYRCSEKDIFTYDYYFYDLDI